MSCERWLAVLADVAAGAPGPPGLEKHLAECEGCRAAFENERRILGRIDAELGAALSLAVSPDFLARARQHAAEKGGERRPWLWPWLVPVAVGVAMLVVGIRVGRRDQPLPPAPPSARPPAIAKVPSPAPAPEEPPAATTPKAAPVRAAEARTSRPVEPEILLPPGETQAYVNYARSLQERRVDRGSLLAAGLDPGELKDVQVPPVEIKPVVIQPIPRSEP